MRALTLAGALTVALAAGGPAPALAAAPEPAPSCSPAPPSGLPEAACSAGQIQGPAGRDAAPDETGRGGGVVEAVLSGISQLVDPVSWLNRLATAAVRPVFEAFGKVVFTTPEVAANSSVRKLWVVLLALTDACLLAVVVARANQVTWGGLIAQIRSKRGLEGVFVGAAAAHLHLLALVPLTALANALTATLLKVGGDNLEVRITTLLPLVGRDSLLQVLLLLAAIVAGFLAVFWSVVRVIALATITVLGPPANMALALEQDHLTRAWWRAQVILLFAPALQVVVYDLALWLFFGSDPLFGGAGDFLSSVFVLVLMWALYKIPEAALRSAAGPLMQAYDQAKSKAKVGLGIAALGLGVPGIGARGLTGLGLARGLMGRGQGGRPPRRAARAQEGRP